MTGRGALAFAGGAIGGGARAVGSGARWAVHAPARGWTGARRRPRRAFTVLGVLAVVFAVAAGAFGWFAWQHSQVEQARIDATASAEKKVSTLLSYDYRTIANDQGGRTALLTGQFKDDYGTLLKQVVGPAAEQQKLTTRSSVTADSVVSTDGADSVTMLMFVNQTTQSSAKPDPTLAGSRLRVAAQRVDGDWLISEMTPV